MEVTKEIVIGILDTIIFDKYDDKYTKYLTKSINYGIEYLEPIDIIIIPRKIYISTKKISHLDPSEYRRIVAKFCSTLVVDITCRYGDKKIKTCNYSFMGVTESIKPESTLDSVRFLLMTEERYATITIDIPPDLSIEVLIDNFDARTDINEECIYIELNN
tara:strand:+ start:7328 stop:7810 length:483 start_codon:yes stop_codon:yes gene_type:complete